MYRWSLIAARLPGRTANDVKNYWHTNLRKKVVPKEKENNEKGKYEETMKSHEVIKPRPRTFSSHSPWLKKNHSFPTLVASNGDVNIPRVASSGDVNIPIECEKTTLPNVGFAQTCVGNDPSSTTSWWESLLNVDEERSNEKIGSCSLLQKDNFTLEFSNVEDFFNNGPTVGDSDWDSTLCDFSFFWGL